MNEKNILAECAHPFVLEQICTYQVSVPMFSSIHTRTRALSLPSANIHVLVLFMAVTLFGIVFSCSGHMTSDEVFLKYSRYFTVLSSPNLICPFFLGNVLSVNQQNKDELFILMEIVQGGELWTYIYEKTSLLPRSKAGGFNVKEAQFYSGYTH